MRLKLFLEAEDDYLTCNYNYSLSSAIYNLLNLGSPEFAKFLHDKGYYHLGKNYKLFTFALRFSDIQITNAKIKLNSNKASLFITSPLIDEFIKSFIMGLFEQKKMTITSFYNYFTFKIKQIEMLPSIEFKNEMNFQLLSPMVLSTKKEREGKLRQYFLRPYDREDINRVLKKNLKNKYELIYNKKMEDTELELEWDKDYLSRHAKVIKKVTINENSKDSVDIIGIQAPFKLRGNPELIKIGYECGFGEKNSMGFGMANIINENISKTF